MFRKKEEQNKDILSWKEMEDKSTGYIKRFREKNYTQMTIDKNKYILLAFIADQHLGNLGTDYKQARMDATLISNCKWAYALGVGDYIDNFIKTKILEPLINQVTSPKEQIQLLEQYLKMFKDKLILMISGNHDRWSKEVSGIDWLAPLAKRNQIKYAPDEMLIDFNLNGKIYTTKIRHKGRFNSSYNLTHTVKQMLRMGDCMFDIGVIAHHHHPAFEQCYIMGNLITAIRTGSYKVADSFVRKIGFPEPKNDMPCVVLSPKEKRVIPFFSLTNGIDFVNLVNK